MAEEEGVKSIRIELNYADADGKRSVKLTTVKFGAVRDRSERRIFVGDEKKSYSMGFSVVLPDHIHAYLIGKSVPDEDRKSVREFSEDFPKTVNSHTLEGLCKEYVYLIDAYVGLKGLEREELKKVIFYTFDNAVGDTKSGWNGVKFGKRSEICYGYFIGYVSKSGSRYNEDRKFINDARDRDVYSQKYVAWTEEREMFYKSMMGSFEAIINRINEFEKGMSDETIDKLITGGKKLLQ